MPRGFDYWESGMDLRLGDDLYDSFVEYQKQLLKQFEQMKDTFHYQTIDASRSIPQVFAELQKRIEPLLPLE